MISMFIESWVEFKNLVIIKKKLPIQYTHDSKHYNIYGAEDGVYVWNTQISKTSSEGVDFETNYKSSSNQPPIIESQPFAAPTHRTKRDASEWVDCDANATTIIDYQLTEERYVSGGEIIYKDAKKGDYITAEVHDADYVIPEAYRAALCEDHPIVAKYIIKKQLKPCSGYDSFEINTYPLNARITAGLYLRVSYVASSESGTREVAVNYMLTKKL